MRDFPSEAWRLSSPSPVSLSIFLYLWTRGEDKENLMGLKRLGYFQRSYGNVTLLILEKIVVSVDLSVPFARVKEVCRERLICSSEVSAGFLATALWYRMCVICLIPCLDDTFKLASPQCVFNARTLLKETFRLCQACLGSLAMPMMQWFPTQLKMSAVTTCCLRCSQQVGLAAREEMWIWIEADKTLRLRNSQMELIWTCSSLKTCVLVWGEK